MWKQRWHAVFFTLVPSVLAGNAFEAFAAGKAAEVAAESMAKAKTRSFDFTYGGIVKGLPVGAVARVWIPVPPSNEQQKIKQIDASLPSDPTIATEPKYGNKVLFFETKAPRSGKIDFSVTYRVKRSEVRGLKSKTSAELTDAQRKLFLAANASVPIDGRPVELLRESDLPKDDALKLAELLYKTVDEHMRYDKSMLGYGNGDAVWACDSGSGNCTDFHSLFISLTRSQGVPARFEIGFPLPKERGQGTLGGYHCWAYFHVDGQGWVPVDISEADKHPEMKDYYFGNLTENRVAFTVGRELMLVPEQNTEALNFFIYPHVEVDGSVWPKEKLRNRFTFKDI